MSLQPLDIFKDPPRSIVLGLLGCLAHTGFSAAFVQRRGVPDVSLSPRDCRGQSQPTWKLGMEHDPTHLESSAFLQPWRPEANSMAKSGHWIAMGTPTNGLSLVSTRSHIALHEYGALGFSMSLVVPSRTASMCWIPCRESPYGARMAGSGRLLPGLRGPENPLWQGVTPFGPESVVLSQWDERGLLMVVRGVALPGTVLNLHPAASFVRGPGNRYLFQMPR